MKKKIKAMKMLSREKNSIKISKKVKFIKKDEIKLYFSHLIYASPPEREKWGFNKRNPFIIPVNEYNAFYIFIFASTAFLTILSISIKSAKIDGNQCRKE
jgi:hypothetical protein